MEKWENDGREDIASIKIEEKNKQPIQSVENRKQEVTKVLKVRKWTEDKDKKNNREEVRKTADRERPTISENSAAFRWVCLRTFSPTWTNYGAV